MCVECLIGKQKKPILFKVTEPSSIPYRTHPACAKRAAVTVFSETVPRKFFLVPESGNRNILLLLFSCTNKRACGDMQDR